CFSEPVHHLSMSVKLLEGRSETFCGVVCQILDKSHNWVDGWMGRWVGKEEGKSNKFLKSKIQNLKSKILWGDGEDGIFKLRFP
nr:hypothetical protein [Leptolyngbyaceae cyanobacterium MO_188.B28]